jgi:HPt (histidine-containing phosphotransfer) domain-containing protein
MFLENGFNDFISKPIDIKRLDTVLNQWIRNKQNGEAMKDAEDRAPEPAQEAAKIDAGGAWLLDHPVEGIDFAAALGLYGNSGAAYIPILKSFVSHTPQLLEKMEKDLEGAPGGYLIAVHGLKGTCKAIGAAETGALAGELESAMREGKTALVRSRNGALTAGVRGLTEGLQKILAEWETSRPGGEKETQAAPDGELLRRLAEAAAALDPDETERILEKLEQYRYEAGEEFIRRLREQAENFDYDAMRQDLETLPDAGTPPIAPPRNT